MKNLTPFLVLLGIAVLFWLAMIRPQQQRQRVLGQMQRDLTTGDEVMLTSGIIGVVRSLDEKTVGLEVSEGVTLRVARAAVGQVTTPAARDDNTELAADPADEPEEN